jgi:transposase
MEDDTSSLCAALFGCAGFEVLATGDVGDELELLVRTTADLVGCPTCGAAARAKDRRPSWVRDLPIGGRPVVLCWWKRVWSCSYLACEQRTWTERHEAIAARASLTERARAWAFEQVGVADAAVSRTAATLGVAWWTVMRQVIDRGTPLVDDPDRLAPPQDPVTAVGVDETAYLRATAHRSTTFATGIANLSPGRAARLLDVVERRSGTVLARWLADRGSAWRAEITTASLDPFRGYATCGVPERSTRC